MNSITNKVEVIENKLNQLLSNYTHLKDEKKHLVQTIEELKEKIKLQKKEIDFLQKSNKMSTIKTHLSDKADESKKMISELIREIDKCVAHLND